MRVITGTARGMKLVTLEGEATRPTREAVKEAVFSMIQFEIEGARVLDLFAGSGQMGIEALSRGATSCVFTDNSPAAVRVIKENLTHTKLMAKARVACCDWSAALHSGIYDIAFVDPPYSSGFMEKLLPALAQRMSDGGIILCESDVHDEMPEQIRREGGDFVAVTSRRYVRNVITVYRRENMR